MIANLLLVVNLFILEGLLSIDNAAVLAIMVKDLPVEQQKKALRYGILGAYALRGGCLAIASYLVHAWFLKIIGGAYLLHLVWGYFNKSDNSIEETKDKNDSGLYKWISRMRISKLLSTIMLVEIMDLAFSIDNIFAAVAISNKFWIIATGVFVGIAAMRFIAGWFVRILNKYPFLENSAFIVIGILGIKLVVSGVASAIKYSPLIIVFEDQKTDLLFSVFMIFIFIVPFVLNIKNNEAHRTKGKVSERN